jgi:hypothetical protein
MILVMSSMVRHFESAPGGAVFALAVGRIERGRQARDLGVQLGIGGRGQGDAELDQEQLAFDILGQGQAVEAGGLFSQTDLDCDRLLVGRGGDGLGIVGDIGLLDPLRDVGGVGGIEQLGFGLLDEGASLLRSAARAAGRQDQCSGHCDRQKPAHE